MPIAVEIRTPVLDEWLRRVVSTHPSVGLEFDSVVPTGGTGQHLWITALEDTADVSAMLEGDSTDGIEVVDQLRDRLLVRFDRRIAVEPLLEVTESVQGQVLTAVGTADGWILKLRFEDATALKSFFEEAEDRGIEVELRGLNPSDGGPESDEGYGLSPPQRETLVLAYEHGYFEIPRQTTLADLADVLGISEQGVSERLRRAIGNYLRATLTSAESELLEE